MFQKTRLTVFCFLIGVSAIGQEEKSADNSEKNKVQTENRGLDARDQSNSKGDVDLTARIRKNVVAEKSFSTNAKNIKIISIAGQVTLKGPVNSVAEKNKIRLIATQIAGKAHVNDEIEIVNK